MRAVETGVYENGAVGRVIWADWDGLYMTNTHYTWFVLKLLSFPTHRLSEEMVS